MSHVAARLVYWPPRILAIAFATFISIFALDVLDEADGFWNVLLALSVHLIPTALLVVALIAAWKWEWVGAGLFTGLAASYASYVLPAHPDWAATIAGPLLLIAVLFLVNWIERRKVRAAL
jgi:hypothetical protein